MGIPDLVPDCWLSTLMYPLVGRVIIGSAVLRGALVGRVRGLDVIMRDCRE